MRHVTKHVFVAGDIFIDLIMSGFPAWPQPGTETFASEFRREIGGGAAITANGLTKLGSRTAVIAVVGPDGDWILNELKHRGIACSGIEVDPTENTSISVAISTASERTFLTYPGANRRFPDRLIQAVKSGKLAQASHIHLGHAPALETAPGLLLDIRKQGCSLSLDVGWHEAWLGDPRSLALLPLIDIFFPNRVEAQRMTGETDPKQILRVLEAAGAKRVALKLGTNGAMLLWDGEIHYAEPYPVKPVDTIGAGDCFDAGFLHFWLQGASPQTCLRAANFCGAASTEAYGGIAGFPNLARVEREALT